LRYKSLDALRGIAALIVVFGHVFGIGFGDRPPEWLVRTPAKLIISASSSVLIFFVISGFVLYLSVGTGLWRGYLNYLTKRFMRLYPPFIAAITFSVILYYVARPTPIPILGMWFNKLSWNSPPSIALVAKHLAMTDQLQWQGLDNVMWSLVHEVRISIVFPIIVVLIARNWLVTVIVTLIISLVSLRVGAHVGATWIYNPFRTLEYVFLFAAGAALAQNADHISLLLCRIPRAFRFAFWSIGLLLFARNNELGISAFIGAILIVTLAFADADAIRVLSLRPFSWLGRVSYSLYLVHLPILLASVHLLYGTIPLTSILLLVVVISFCVAELSYRFVEAPSIRLGRFIANRLGGATALQPFAKSA